MPATQVHMQGPKDPYAYLLLKTAQINIIRYSVPVGSSVVTEASCCVFILVLFRFFVNHSIIILYSFFL